MIDHTSEIKSPANNEYNLEVNNPDNIVDHKNVTIRSLEEKLRLLDEEKLDLESQIYAAEKKYHEQLDSYLARYINADFSLAQMEYILPAKRAKSSKMHGVSSNSLGIDANSLIMLKHFFEPSVNLVYKKLHEATKEAQNKYRQSNDDMLAWRFSPESSIGKSLMSRIRQLLNANEELGRVNQADRVARLESEAELQATCMKEFIKANEDIEGVLEEAYTDLEGLQSSLLILQQQINQTESVVETLQNELESRQPGIVAELMTAMLSKFSETETEVGDGEDDNCKPTLEVHVQSEQDNVENDIDDAKREETCPEEK
ncbi:Pre-mRNA-splicing regulator female-lethal(2)D [Schistosoma japonicum]|uniref:Pre-mRNA-splicing regulator female-lethal(2)D n=1 Tax=Schistosoma japonicum TaxID=6182 RepID=A0A4Z2DJ48_SCHJA|nr:Pre-mRNA-splicing regulator female-lethal(2)D [Schistosoma japonicum]